MDVRLAAKGSPQFLDPGIVDSGIGSQGVAQHSAGDRHVKKQAPRDGTVPASRGALRLAFDWLYLVSGALGGVAIFAILALMLLQVVFREAGLLFRGADDLTAWSCAAAVFLPLAHTFKRGELVRMGLVLDRFDAATRHRAELVALVVTTAFIAYATYWAARLSYESWLIDDLAQGMLPVPMWIPQSSMTIGLAVFLIALVDELVVVLRGAEPTYDAAARARHAEGNFSGEI
jgi:TRAP-type C4-dicarboxylate transport system permease small subunit